MINNKFSIDCITLAVTEKQCEELLNSNDFLIGFFEIHRFAGIPTEPLYNHTCKISLADLITAHSSEWIFNNVFDEFEFLSQQLNLSGDKILWHFELAIDLHFDFEENTNLLQALILYYHHYNKGKKTIAISDLTRSVRSGYSSKIGNTQLMIYNKSAEILKDDYDFRSPPLTRIEFRYFGLNEVFSSDPLRHRCNVIFEFFRNYDPTTYEAIEQKIAKNLMNNFHKQRNIYYKKFAQNKKFSIKTFLISQQEYIVSKNVIRLFYGYLKNENFVIGTFDTYFYKVLLDVNFNFFDSNNLGNLCKLIINELFPRIYQ